MANFIVAAGSNVGTAQDDHFELKTSPLDFTIDGGEGYDVLTSETKLLFQGDSTWENLEELKLFGKNVEGYYLHLFGQVKNFDLSATEDLIIVTPHTGDQVIKGGVETFIEVDEQLPTASVVNFDMASGAASGMVVAEEQGGSVKGTYTNITGIQTFGTNDTIYGADGFQWVEMGTGVNFFDGRDGEDRAIYNGATKHFSLTLDKAGKITVQDRRIADTNVDTLVNVEQIYFDGDDDPLRDFTLYTGVINVSPSDLSAFIEMYIAYFNRAPDALGLYYWGTRLSQGMSKEKIAESFYVQPETQALYTNPDDTEGFVTAVYNNFLGRAPDAEGFAYWVKQLDDGIVSKPKFLLAIINGAKAETGSQTDVDYFTNKANIGAYFSVIKGMSNPDNAKAAMALYDGTEASIAAAKNAIDGYYASALDAENGEALIPLVGVMDDPFAV